MLHFPPAQESHPLAWPSVAGGLRPANQVSKVLQANMDRIIDLRKRRLRFVRNSGNYYDLLTSIAYFLCF